MRLDRRQRAAGALLALAFLVLPLAAVVLAGAMLLPPAAVRPAPRRPRRPGRHAPAAPRAPPLLQPA